MTEFERLFSMKVQTEKDMFDHIYHMQEMERKFQEYLKNKAKETPE
jgi:hypothetical protein